MKKLVFSLLVAMLPLMGVISASAQNKSQIKCGYVLKNLKLDKATAAKFKPLFMNYVNELKAAKDVYDNVKDKYKPAIKSGRLTDAQASQLLNAHWNSDARETAVKRKYTSVFTSCIGVRKTFEAFDYASDSMKKMKGGKKSDDDE
jgi:Skp family chaperone for outer membrane proteins